MMKNYSSNFWRWPIFVLLFLAGIFPADAQTPCNEPLNLTVQSVNTTGATLVWTAPNPAPWQGYDYYWTSIQGQAPNASSPPDGSTFATSVTISENFNVGATIYFYVRSNCSEGNSTWEGPKNFTVLAPNSGCTTAPFGLKPQAVFTPAYTGVPEVINADAYAGEYSIVNVMADRQFVFNTSNPNDYITIANVNTAQVIAHGASSLTWNSESYAGPIRYYISTNSSCGTQELNRTRYVTAQLVPSGCGTPNGFYTSSISTNGAILHWNDTTSPFSDEFEYYFSTSATTPNINTTPSGTTTFEYKELTGLSANMTYHYWVRSVCDDGTGAWTYGGNFTTQATEVTGCVGAIYGQNPSTVFVPGCFGNQEIISTDMWAGEYTLIDVLPNKIYTFTSSVGTDFITIRDEATSVGYASGTTPLVWSSGANTTQIKMFLHLSLSCGSQNINRTTTITCQDAATGCAAPSALLISAVTSSSANLSWVAANPAPSDGYQYFYSTVNTPPAAGATPLGNSASTGFTLNGLNANTMYYIWIRSNCGSSQSTWVFGNSFNTVGAGTGCTTAPNGQYPDAAFTPACFGNNEVIVTNAYAGEYSLINATANTQYTFSSSAPSDYITIANADASVTFTAGNTPLVWNSGSNGGVIRYYLHVNSACGSNTVERTKLISCQASGGCAVPGGLSASNVAQLNATLNWTAISPAPSGGYQYYLNSTGIAPTAETPPSGNVGGASVSFSALIAGTTYYFWVRSDCGASQSEWSGVWTFNTSPIPATGCTNEVWGQYPTAVFTPTCGGGNEIIVTDAYAGEHSMITITANKQYTFTSSIATDFITIANNDGSVVYASGISPVIWQSGTDAGVFRYFIHNSPECGGDTVDRVRSIECAAPLAGVEVSISGFEWYPNPVTDRLYLQHTGVIERVAVSNMLGQTVQQQECGSAEVTLNFDGLAKGIYLVTAFSAAQSKTFKIVKE